MKEVTQDKNLIAYCGLYCGACRKFLEEKCPGCRENMKAAWCKIRTCCQSNDYQSCADCTQVAKAMDCKKFNNIFSKFFALVFKSDRQACINRLKEVGPDKFAQEMTDKKEMTIKRT